MTDRRPAMFVCLLLAVNDLGDEIHATPALTGGRIYLRTRSALYCFGAK